MIQVKSRDRFLEVLSTYLPEKSKCVELGSYRGDFADKILKIVNPRCLFLVDPYRVDESRRYGAGMAFLPVMYSTSEDYENVLSRFEKERNAGQVFVFRTTSQNLAKKVGERIFDCIYIDSDHTYEGVKKDLEDWMPKLKEGGVICGHDYTNDNEFGVVQSVDEFIEEHGFEFIIFNTDGGDWALQKTKTK